MQTVDARRAVLRGLRVTFAFSHGGWGVDSDFALALQVMTAHGRKVVRNGNTLETEDESRQALLEDANTFQAKQLPILKALQVA